MGLNICRKIAFIGEGKLECFVRCLKAVDDPLVVAQSLIYCLLILQNLAVFHVDTAHDVESLVFVAVQIANLRHFENSDLIKPED